MSASIEIGAEGAQALAGGSNIVAWPAAGFSGIGRANLDEKVSAAPGESVQSQWQSVLMQFGGQSAQPGDAIRETEASHDLEDALVGNLNAKSAPQRVIASTGTSTGEDQDDQAAASTQAAGSHAFGARNLRTNALRASQLQLTPAVDVGADSAGRTSALRPLSGLTRRQGKQAGNGTSNSPKTHSSEQTTSLPAVAPVPLAAPPSPISTKPEVFTGLASTAAASARTGAKSQGNAATEESVVQSVKGERGESSSSLPVTSGDVASLRPEQSESSEVTLGLTSTKGTTSTAECAGVSLKTMLSSPELQSAEKIVSKYHDDLKTVQAALTPATAGASSHTTPAILRSVNANGSSEASVSQGMHAAAVQPIPAVDSPALSHISGGLHGGIHPAVENAPAIDTTSAASSREAFSALDAGSGNGGPAWLHASAQRAEAGFNDPALGWVGVRADMGPGGVHAAIVPASADAVQTLSSHMAGLNAHLTAEHVPVESLKLATATGSESQGGMQQGTAQNHDQGTQQQSQAGGTPVSSGPLNNLSAPVAANGEADMASESAQPILSYTGGAHISVIA